MIQITGGFFLPPSPASLEQPALRYQVGDANQGWRGGGGARTRPYPARDQPEREARRARVGDHLAAAERLISQSHQAVERATAWLQHTDRRVRHTCRQLQEVADAAQPTLRWTAGEELADDQAEIAAVKEKAARPPRRSASACLTAQRVRPATQAGGFDSGAATGCRDRQRSMRHSPAPAPC